MTHIGSVVNGPIGDESPVLAPKDGNGPSITLDETDRTHLDLHVADEAALEAEVERLVVTRRQSAVGRPSKYAFWDG